MARFGVCEHLHRYENHTEIIDQLAAAGVKWVRISPGWESFETSKGVYSNIFKAKMDDIIDKLRTKDIQVSFVLCYTAKWASRFPNDENASRFPPGNWSDWESYVTWVTNRYKGKVQHWEVWNEPDLASFWKGTSGEYLTLLQKASVKIRAADPDNKVLMGALALPDGDAGTTFFDSILLAGAGTYFDIVNYHVYWDSHRMVGRHAAIQAIVANREISAKPIWVTETGFSTCGYGNLEVLKSDRVNQAYATHFGLPNVERVFWYLNRNANVSDPGEANYGLATNAGNPLRAFFHYQAAGGAVTDFQKEMAFKLQYTNLPMPRTLTLVRPESGDGSYVTGTSPLTIPATRFAYFRVNDDWIFNANGGLDPEMDLVVSYYDDGAGSWGVQYDSAGDLESNIYRGTETVARTNSLQWKEKVFSLSDLKFANRQNNQSDFRIWAGNQNLRINWVMARRKLDVGAVQLAVSGTDMGRLVERVHSNNPPSKAYNPNLTYQGEPCRKIGIIDGSEKALYVQVCDGLMRKGDTRSAVRVRFYNDGIGQLGLEYSALSGPKTITKSKNAYPVGWQAATFDLDDANFTNAQDFLADFRITNGGDGGVEYVSRVEVVRKEHLWDDFQDGNSEGWTTLGGTWGVQLEGLSNRVFRQTNAGSPEFFAFAGQSAWTDVSVSAVMRFYSQIPNGAGLVVRYQGETADDPKSYYLFSVTPGASGEVSLKKCVNGTVTQLDSRGKNIPYQQDLNLTFEARGGYLRARLNNEEVLSAFDASLPSGKIGVRGNGANIGIDDVLVKR